jgi:hypothetical protein
MAVQAAIEALIAPSVQVRGDFGGASGREWMRRQIGRCEAADDGVGGAFRPRETPRWRIVFRGRARLGIGKQRGNHLR